MQNLQITTETKAESPGYRMTTTQRRRCAELAVEIIGYRVLRCRCGATWRMDDGRLPRDWAECPRGCHEEKTAA